MPLAPKDSYTLEMPILCTLKNITLSFGNKELFQGAELAIDAKDRIGLLGLNGQGKSSLFKILTGDVVPDHNVPPFEFSKAKGDEAGTVAFSIFAIPQDLPEEAKNLHSIKDVFFYFRPEFKRDFHILSHPLEYAHQLDEAEHRFSHLGGWELLQKFESYLKLFDLSQYEDKKIEISRLSGGEQKKILLALGLSANENLILWDEPTNHLDMETISLLEDELDSTEKAFILISHDRTLLSKLTKKIFHIRRGKIESFQGSYTDYLEYLKESEQSRKKLLERLKNNLSRETAWMRQGIKARGTRSKKRVENYLDLKGKVETIKAEAKKSLDLMLSQTNRQTKILADYQDVAFSYDGQRTLFQNINVTIQKGDKIGLVGRNGVGKSTFVKLITGELTATKGRVKTQDDLKIQYLSQKREQLDPEKTPYDLLTSGSDYITMPNGSTIHVVSYFESFLFHRDELNRPLKTFSGGEKSRLQLAYNLTLPGDLLIFDEPTNDLDLETIQILEEKLSDFEGSIILISHDRAFLSNVTNKVWLLDKGKIESFQGGYDQVQPYLEALQLENELTENAATDESEALKRQKATAIPDKKTSNKDKEKIKELQNLIQKTEEKLSIIEDKIANFDYAKLNDPKNGEFAILSNAKELLENQLMDYYSEQESLEKKS